MTNLEQMKLADAAIEDLTKCVGTLSGLGVITFEDGMKFLTDVLVKHISWIGNFNHEEHTEFFNSKEK